MSKYCKSCSHFIRCWVKSERGFSKCPCNICLVKVMCKKTCKEKRYFVLSNYEHKFDIVETGSDYD